MELACKQPNCLWPATPSHHPTGKMRTRAPALKRRHEPYGMLSMLHRQTVNPQSSQLCTHTRMLEHNNKCSEIHHQPQPLREWLTASQSARPKHSASRHNLQRACMYGIPTKTVTPTLTQCAMRVRRDISKFHNHAGVLTILDVHCSCTQYHKTTAPYADAPGQRLYLCS